MLSGAFTLVAATSFAIPTARRTLVAAERTPVSVLRPVDR
jgi:hypothetical protein